MASVSDLMSFSSLSSSFDTWKSRDDKKTQRNPVRYVREGEYDPKFDAFEAKRKREVARRGHEAAELQHRQRHSLDNSYLNETHESEKFFSVDIYSDDDNGLPRRTELEGFSGSSLRRTYQSRNTDTDLFSRDARMGNSDLDSVEASMDGRGYSDSLSEVLNRSYETENTRDLPVVEEYSPGSKSSNSLLEFEKAAAAAHEAAQQRLYKRDVSPVDAESHPTSQQSEGSVEGLTEITTISTDENNQNLGLHELCGEATSVDDIAWRNALYLLAIQPELATVTDNGWTPLHVCCVGNAPPPEFMVRALLFCNNSGASAKDNGGRLPLHMVAASSGDRAIMQLLVDQYPQAVYQKDTRGLTPLHLLLKNENLELTVERVRILLGQTLKSKCRPLRNRVLQRLGDHLDMKLEDINKMIENSRHDETPDSALAFMDHQQEAQTEMYPEDVQVCFRKMAQWKRKQVRLHQDTADAIENSFPEELQETNPAAIALTPSMQLPLHMVLKRRFPDFIAESDDPDLEAFEHRPGQSEILRLFISVYPEALIACDVNGRTPLMTALLVQDSLPSLDVIQLLLGMRTSSYGSPPDWARDMPLHESTSGRYINPAMVPSSDTNQLPLHVAAEEMPSFFAAIESIYSSYPGAVNVQDIRGRTPLHIALRNYQRIEPDPQVVALLLTDRVAQIRDDDGLLPFDLLVRGSHNLPLKEPSSSSGRCSTRPCDVYKKFFNSAILQSPRPRCRQESLIFLRRLRKLPSWLRRQACAAGFVQDMLLEETSSMGKCGVILSTGTLLGVLLVLFRLQMGDFIDGSGVVTAWYAPAIYTIVSILLLYQVFHWKVSASLSVGLSHCILNIWVWIDVSALLLAIMSTALIHGANGNRAMIGSFGTATVGVLWCSVIGYMARWWHGMAIFMGGTLQLAKLLFWPMIVAAALVVGFAQMFYTFSVSTDSGDCGESLLGGHAVCDVRDAYVAVYFLLLGTPFVNTTENSDSSPGSILLIASFTVLWVLLLLSLLVSVVMEASRLNLEEVALTWYWEPLLNFTFLIRDLTTCCSYSRDANKDLLRDSSGEKLKLMWQPSFEDSLSLKLESIWNVAMFALLGGEKGQSDIWFLGRCINNKSPLLVWLLRVCALLGIPLWVIVGFATFGLLLPPQVRRWIFHPSSSGIQTSPTAEYSASQVVAMRSELLSLKRMSYEKSNDVKQDIRELKGLILAAMQG